MIRDFYAKLRNDKGVTDRQVCEATGIKPSTFYDWLRGDSATLGGDKAIALAQYFDVPLDSFIEPLKKKEETT